MPTIRFEHVHLRSPDPEAAAAWYVRMLGAEITDRLMNGAALRVVLALGGTQLFIEQVPASTPTPPPPPFQGIEHFGLVVTDFEDLVEELRAKGVVFATQPKTVRLGLKIAFLQAPDGAQVEILERSAD